MSFGGVKKSIYVPNTVSKSEFATEKNSARRIDLMPWSDGLNSG